MAAKLLQTAVAGTALLALLNADPATAQALPDPPRADRQPMGLAEPRIAPLPAAQWTSEHYRLAARHAPPTDRIRAIGDAVGDILDRARTEQRPPEVLAEEMARARVAAG